MGRAGFVVRDIGGLAFTLAALAICCAIVFTFTLWLALFPPNNVTVSGQAARIKLAKNASRNAIVKAK